MLPPALTGPVTDGEKPPTVYDALSRFAGNFLQRQDIPWTTRKTLTTVLRCRTPAISGHRYTCDECGFVAQFYNSCGNRYCPQCQGPRRYEWAERQQALLLPVPHFQVVFTLPSALRPIARVFPKEVFNALFDASNRTLLTLAGRHWCAKPTILSVLHTWTRTLTFHPHVHCVVSCGGLTADDRWVDVDERFLFAHRAMQSLFRGTFLTCLRTRLAKACQELDGRQETLVRLAALQPRWVVFVEAADGRDKQCIVKYLARYVYQAPISNHRMLAVSDTTVTFRARDDEIVTVPGIEFVRRFALHVLPKGFRKVRQSGLLAPNLRKRLEVARALLPPPAQPDELPAADAKVVHAIGPAQCPHCGGKLRYESIPRDQSFNPLIRGPP